MIASSVFADDSAPGFNRDIRPILSQNCFQCHGFDSKQRKAGLRLDELAGATTKLETGKTAIVPGDGDASEILRRLTSNDPEQRMPPSNTGKEVSAEQVTMLRRWIEAGAKYEPHWAFVAPRRPDLDSEPRVNPIDALIRARLAEEKLEANPPADPVTLYRRLSLDLMGLPPDPNGARAFSTRFEQDPEAALERAVGEFLDSPHFGEKWARWWMDTAHYADTAGYSVDYERPHAWRWRDWVVTALNRNQPFDQFTIEQIAGDLLPNASIEQKIATGFFRHTLSNREGGADLEEFRVKQVKDRTRTLGSTWLGLTIECAECHDHKFDPITQRDFYALYAFFNAADEINVDAPLAGEAEARRAAIADYREKRSALIEPIRSELEQLQSEWERRILHAEENPGLDYKRDRLLELLGILWGKGEGEGQLEGLGIVKTPLAERSEEQKERLLEFFLERGSLGLEDEFRRLGLSDLKKALAELNDKLPRVSRPPTLTAAMQPRESFVHLRGDFRSPGEAVSAAVPEQLRLAGHTGATRLDLARWLVAAENPLTARVVVNRVWHELFGRGIVETTEDFGAQGRPPSHPELLDWLAVTLVESGWDLKHLIHRIVTSNTYRQSSVVRPDLIARDPNNELLARQSRLRLPAELVRDVALAASGLLERKIGGPSVRPPQPASVSMEGSYGNQWQPSEGADRYRRGLYTFIQRISPYAQYQTFDLPNVNRSCTRRGRSNTPLQALTLLNDPVFVEAAGALADRMVRETAGGGEVDDFIRHGFRLSLGRSPEEEELRRLMDYHRQQTEFFKTEEIDDPSRAALVGTASVLLNLDEFITRE